MDKDKIYRRFKVAMTLFIVLLFLSGLTAMPVIPELKLLLKILNPFSQLYQLFDKVLAAYMYVQQQYNFLLYGYDWLAFAHFVLAILFIGPYKNPIQNIWVIEFGLIACVLVLPFAFLAGHFRGIPIWWRIGDCSFGVFGFLLLWYCRKLVLQLKTCTN